MSQSQIAAWLDGPANYCSVIGEEPSQPVNVFDWRDVSRVTDESPGPMSLRLEARSRCSPRMRAIGAGGQEIGFIRRDGIVPRMRYAMHRAGQRVWTLSVRSIFRSRYLIELSNGESWMFGTPFFSIQVVGSTQSIRRLFGNVGSANCVWLIWIEPGWDSIDLLAAVAFMHRQWFHS